MNILLFGGAFDPPHLGHQLVIEPAFELLPEIDELWLLPCYRHTFDKSLTPAPHRLAMCRLLIQHLSSTINHRLRLCPIEIEHQTGGSTYQTWQLLHQESLDITFSFLIGSDQLASFPKWGYYQLLLKAMPFYVYPRADYPMTPLLPGMTALSSPTQIITNISSSLIKTRLRQKLSVTTLLLKTINRYIQLHDLYSDSHF
ncbi:nicotinate (nicotinamide) nucleotide adenylyltransferase [Microgenomates group bacterium RBG_16_45_19]|nr:MAG: nicotinate (nicotinamide) nucleotide adenylyltransferase [Microgenomates group bacterium RBG_16_45_19]